MGRRKETGCGLQEKWRNMSKMGAKGGGGLTDKPKAHSRQ